MSDKEPFQKPMRQHKDEASSSYREQPRGSYKSGIQHVHVFNANAVDKAPTTSATSYRSIEKNKFLPRPPKYK